MSIHPTAVVGPGCQIAPDADVGPYSVIGFDQEADRAQYYGNPTATNEVWPPTVIGSGTTVGAHCCVGRGALLGDKCLVEPYSFVGERCTVGTRNFIRYRAWISARVVTGDDCVIAGFLCRRTVLGSRVAFFGSTVHRFAGIQRAVEEAAPVIENDVLVGFNAVIVGGVRVPTDTVVPVGTVFKEGPSASQ